MALLARERAAAAGVAYRAPHIERPRPSQWRAPLGIKTKPISGGNKNERHREMKEASIARLKVERIDLEQHDAAEAALIGLWFARVLRATDWHQPSRRGPKPIVCVR